MNVCLAGATVLVGIDFSEPCEQALLRAVTLAEKTEALIELVHIFEWASHKPARNGCGMARLDPADPFTWDAVMAQARVAFSRLGQLCSVLVGDRVSAEICVIIGEPVTGLLLAAERAGAPLIVLGAHGRRALPPGAVGTTAERVRASSGVPVLLVSRPEPVGKIEGPSVPHPRRDPVVCSCSRCGMVERPRIPSRKCASCGSQPGIWVSGPSPESSPQIGGADPGTVSDPDAPLRHARDAPRQLAAPR